MAGQNTEGFEDFPNPWTPPPKAAKKRPVMGANPKPPQKAYGADGEWIPENKQNGPKRGGKRRRGQAGSRGPIANQIVTRIGPSPPPGLKAGVDVSKYQPSGVDFEQMDAQQIQDAFGVKDCQVVLSPQPDLLSVAIREWNAYVPSPGAAPESVGDVPPPSRASVTPEEAQPVVSQLVHPSPVVTPQMQNTIMDASPSAAELVAGAGPIKSQSDFFRKPGPLSKRPQIEDNPVALPKQGPSSEPQPGPSGLQPPVVKSGAKSKPLDPVAYKNFKAQKEKLLSPWPEIQSTSEYWKARAERDRSAMLLQKLMTMTHVKHEVIDEIKLLLRRRMDTITDQMRQAEDKFGIYRFDS